MKNMQGLLSAVTELCRSIAGWKYPEECCRVAAPLGLACRELLPHRVWVKMFICYQPLVPEVGREAKLPLRIDSEDLLGIVQLCFQNVLTYLHNKTNQNNINGSGELLDCSGCVWQWVFMSFSQYRQNLNTTEILNTTTPWYPWQTACCFSCLLGKGDGLAAVQLEQMLVKQQTKKKSTRVDLSFCHIE